MHHTFAETKEVVSRLGPKPKFPNRAFGDTEDSHFLFYFSIMTILSMLFYLALYNKKKVSKPFFKTITINLNALSFFVTCKYILTPCPS